MRDFPDPFVTWTGTSYHALSTASGLLEVPHTDSTDLTDWTRSTEMLAATPVWATRGSTWSPAVLNVAGPRVVAATSFEAGVLRVDLPSRP